MTSSAPVLVTGANGFVGSWVCRALADRGAEVRALVRRAGTAPRIPGLTELTGDFTDPDRAASAVEGVGSLITTVHPMDSDRETQHRIGVEGTAVIARAAAAAGVRRLIHISTAGVYARAPAVGDVDEDSALVGDDGGAYSVTKRDADLALGEVEGITRVLLRPPAILGPGETSVWNTLRPAEIRDQEAERHAIADQTFAWVHVSDLAALAADLATGAVADADDPAAGPVPGGCTVLNVAGGAATQRDYYGTVTEALGVEPIWDAGDAWTGRLRADRARGWGWRPAVDLPQALAELASGLRADA